MIIKGILRKTVFYKATFGEIQSSGNERSYCAYSNNIKLIILKLRELQYIQLFQSIKGCDGCMTDAMQTYETESALHRHSGRSECGACVIMR